MKRKKKKLVLSNKISKKYEQIICVNKYRL